ncbi:MAG: acyl-CoA thioesterase II [Calditrichia bacterium]
MKTINDLFKVIQLEKIENNIFRGDSIITPWKRVFGGQVLSQALNAAIQTVDGDRCVHSMHGYFILPGDVELPIVYEVDRIRDGGSFATRRVVAIQKGRAIFSMGASFQLEQEGLDHQVDMPDVPGPEDLPSDQDTLRALGDKLPASFSWMLMDRPIEFRPIDPLDPLNPEKRPPQRHIWMRAKGKIPDDKSLHREILAFASDYNLLTTSLRPHFDKVTYADLQLASIDHAMWFHRSFRMDDWLLYALDSPSASGTRGFTRGSVYSRSGELVASVVQEGLIRPKR